MLLVIGVDMTLLKGKDHSQVSAAFILLERFMVFMILVNKVFHSLVSLLIFILFFVVHQILEWWGFFFGVLILILLAASISECSFCRGTLRRSWS
jgi:hypothetical protein